MKICCNCKQEKEETEFAKNKTKKDGWASVCKACNKLLCHLAYIRMRAEHCAYVKVAKDIKLGRTRKECISCKENKTLNQYWLVNGKYRKRVCKACERKKNPRVYNQLQQQKDARKAREKRQARPAFAMVKDARNWDHKRGFTKDPAFTVEFVTQMIAQGCIYCGETQIRISLDRIDNSKGHTIDNVVPACIRCNLLRRDMPYAPWLFVAHGMREAREKGLFEDWTGEIHKQSKKENLMDDRLTASEITALEEVCSWEEFEDIIECIKESRDGRTPEDLSETVFGTNGTVIRLKRKFMINM